MGIGEASGFIYCSACNQDYHTTDGHICPATLIQQAEQRKRDRAQRMPETTDALVALFDAYQRLRELGWRDAIYAAPNTEFEVIEVGSAGVHLGSLDQETGWWICDAGDAWPARPCLFRLKKCPNCKQSGNHETGEGGFACESAR